MKRGVFTVAFLLLLIMLIILPLTSAEFLKGFYAKITGKATESTNLSITVSGTNPVVITVLNRTLVDTIVDPTISGNTSITFFVNVSDPNGYNDINASSVNASFIFHDTGAGEATRVNTSYGCISKGNIDSKSLNFSCCK